MARVDIDTLIRCRILRRAVWSGLFANTFFGGLQTFGVSESTGLDSGQSDARPTDDQEVAG